MRPVVVATPRSWAVFSAIVALCLASGCSTPTDSAVAASSAAGASSAQALPTSAPDAAESATQPAADGSGLVGQWHGTIELPGQPLDIGLTFVEGDGTLKGTIDIPAQLLLDSPLTDVSQNGTAVSFAIPEVPGDPTFSGTLDAGTVSGEFSQSGVTAPFSLNPGPLPEPERPQLPQPPFPYASQDVSVASGTVSLAGTLTTPQGPGPFTAVVMITGSGAQDRDETLFGHKPFLVMADALTRAGYAVLRMDDRGVGGSTGDLAASNYDDLAADVAAGVSFLRARPDIGQVGLFGHSEGGYLAPLVAQRDPHIAFVILMAGPAVPGDQIVEYQQQVLLAQAGLPQDQINTTISAIRERNRLLLAGDDDGAAAVTREMLAEQGVPADQIDAQLPNLVSPNMRALLGYDPAPALDALTVPLLAVYGSKDLQVSAEQSVPPLQALVADQADATVQTLPNLNHLMQPAQTGSPSEYGTIETTLDESFLDLVEQWMQQRFPPR